MSKMTDGPFQHHPDMGNPISDQPNSLDRIHQPASGSAISPVGSEGVQEVQEAVPTDEDLGTTDLTPRPTEAETDAPADRPPLFNFIDNQGDPSVPKEQKITPIFDAGSVLKELGAPETFADDVARVSETLRPLGALVLAREPSATERTELEGRGAYHTGIPVGETTATVYVKGVGNERAAATTSPDAAFPGFPADTGNLLFDDPSGAHPRILGTESVQWGLMEGIDAAELLADIAKHEGFTSVEDALRAGSLTIPLNVLRFNELEQHLNPILEARRTDASNDRITSQGLEWEGNRHLSTVSLIVPGNMRIEGGVSSRADALARLTDPETAQAIGHTIRTMTRAGMAMTLNSAHGQNMYTLPEGVDARRAVIQADNSDLISLGAFKGRDVEYRDPATGEVSVQQVTADQQRQLLLFQSLERQSNFTPPHRPYPESSVQVSWEQVVAAQQAFAREMLHGLADPQALDAMAHYLPFMRTEYNAAAARILIDSHDGQPWEATAARKEQILARYEAEYGALTEYRQNLEDCLPPYNHADLHFRELQTTGRLRSEPVRQYLLTGDESHLRQDVVLSRAIDLSRAIETIPDHHQRDALLALCSDAFSTREIHAHFESPVNDLATIFEGRHYEQLTQLIQNGDIEKATSYLRVLALSLTDAGEIFAEERTGEINRHKWPRMLLEGETPVAAIEQQALISHHSTQLGRLAYSGGRGVIQMLRLGDPPPFNVSTEAGRLGHPSVSSVLQFMLPIYNNNALSQRRILDWFARYSPLATQLEQTPDPPMDMIAQLLPQLDALAQEISGFCPELALAHNSFAASLLCTSDPALANTYYQRGMSYYQQQFPYRQTLVAAPAGEWSTIRWTRDPATGQAIARRYERLRFGWLARAYRNFHNRGLNTW